MIDHPEIDPSSEARSGHTASPARRFMRRLLRQKTAVVSIAFLALLIVVALLADALMPYDPTQQELQLRNLPPHGAHPFGTDDLGRDILSRMIAGTGITLLAPVIAVGAGLVLGLPAGLLAGYLGGWFDWVSSRVADALFAIPGLVLVMAVVAVRGQSTVNAMMAVGVLFAPRFYRVMRAETILIRKSRYVEASIMAGASQLRVLRTHIVPNIAPSLIVQCTVLLGIGVLVEAGISFFGIGVQPPDASWGVVLRRSFDGMSSEPSLTVAPGLAITLLILALQFLGDGMRDSLGKEVRRDA